MGGGGGDERDTTELKGGRYTLVRRLGEGSQAETFEARDHGEGGGARRSRPDEPLTKAWDRYVAQARGNPAPPEPPGTPGRLVAIKRFRVGRAKAWKDVELAEREATTLASLRHPNLPRYIEHFEEDGALYLVMEKVEGESLAAVRARRGRLDHAEIVRMLEDLGEALRYLHARAPVVVHRDIKPGNVIRRPDGSYALVDFGSVRDRLKPAGGSTVVGTFGYMAPEQFQGRASPRSDLYGLAATALTMLTGSEPEELPHEGLGIDVPRALAAGVPAPLIRTLTAMLQPDPDRRAASIDEALTLLHDAPPETRRERRARRKQRKREEREARRRRDELARERRVAFVPRVFAKLGLFVALLVVSLTVGLLVPLLLGILSILFGKSLRRAASACVRAALRTQEALGRASAWLSGHRAEDDALVKVRVADEPRARVLVETDDAGSDAREDEDAPEPAEVGDVRARRRR